MSVPRIGNGTQACEACKYQRRKCAPDCILAPYFPHGRQRQFLNCHKLFGVSNITKIIRNLHPPDKDEAMRTIIFQSDVRASDPVGGCYRIIRDLQRQIEYTKAELDLVLHHLAICRATHQQQQASIPESPSSISIDPDPLNSYYHHQHHLLHPHPHDYVVQQKQNQDINAWVMHDVDSLHVKDGGFVDVDDIKPLLDINGDGDDGVDVDHRSDEVVLKEGRGILKEDNDSIQHAQDHDLKGAATLFTLTNCNA
ncbi:hypothetical protein AAG906_029505 [Vitis piasezkii]|uniref:LOB domain-containing protein 22 n=1 Tax=Vitis riparia TaxID=96939 RepID=UPI00155A08BB|nr:LOB domain-containing protein 22 [Vitis riparia]